MKKISSALMVVLLLNMLQGLIVFSSEQADLPEFSHERIIVQRRVNGISLVGDTAMPTIEFESEQRLAILPNDNGQMRTFGVKESVEIVALTLREKGREQVLDAVEYVKSMPNVIAAEPDYMLSAESVTNDPMYDQLYGLDKISAPQAWDNYQQDEMVTVGVIDTGIDYNHPDLADNMWINKGEIAGNGIDDDANGFIDDIHGWDFANNDNNPMDDHYHGTHVAGTIGAVRNNGIGVAGVAPKVKLMALKFMSSSGTGYNSNAIESLAYANMMGAKITNNSYGGSAYSQIFFDLIKVSGLFVAAAGNLTRNNDKLPYYPASYLSSNVISVAAVDAQDKMTWFSSYGVMSVHVAAPGSGIVSTVPKGQYKALNGTSMAAPHVAGAAAYIMSVMPDVSIAELKNRIISNSDYVESLSKYVLGGRLNLNSALGYFEYVPVTGMTE